MLVGKSSQSVFLKFPSPIYLSIFASSPVSGDSIKRSFRPEQKKLTDLI